jgi:2-oxoglutarate ferredoxin oxidoreductase subunit beta
MQAIDPVATAIALGGSFVARGFSGDREQLVPLIKAGIRHEGCAVLDVISPCVTFNDHEGSTKSYAYTRRNYHPAVYTDFVPPAEEITAQYGEGEAISVTLHDGSRIRLRKAHNSYDPSNRSAVMHYLEEQRAKGEVVTGLLFIDESLPEMHVISKTEDFPLAGRGFEDLNPGSEALTRLQKGMR